jgi:putative PEP-CTERM system histidine kinase
MLVNLMSLWSHVFAAVTFAVLTIWQAKRCLKTGTGLPLLIASLLTMSWGLACALAGPQAVASRVTESLRDLAWLGYMVMLWRGGGQARESYAAIKTLYAVILAVVCGRIAVDLLPITLAGSLRLVDAVFYSAVILRMISAVGALMLVHNLYTAATSQTRDAIRMPLIALAILWAFDLNIATVTYMARSIPAELLALRGLIAGLLAPLFALGVVRSGEMPVKLSRTATFQSLSLIGVGGYLIVMVGGSAVLQLFGDQWVRLFQVGFAFITALAALVLLPNDLVRARARVLLSKHFFQHRYDYRAEWLRFTNTLGRPDGSAAALNERAIKAVADITESGGGLLLVPDPAGGLVLDARWNWAQIELPARLATPDTISYFESTGRIFDLDAVRNDTATEEEADAIPDWLANMAQAWAIVPLIHFERLAGLVVLDRPLLDRKLDWEDFDLLRVAGRQVASYLAEAKGQETLSDVQRFDEFNRRFAFIMHDIKNLVSQLSLVTRNAERHIGNPAFQRDMIATLDNSTRRMNDLLARLSQHNKGKAEEPRPIPLGALADTVAAPRRAAHPVIVSGDPSLFGVADPTRLEQALGHLVQNAIEASEPSDPVTVHIELFENEPVIRVIDTGIGMSNDFIANQLFKPFTSTKEGGFGIGAYEARSLIAGMGGRLTVKSRVGHGCTFSITLPSAIDQFSYRDIAA